MLYSKRAGRGRYKPLVLTFKENQYLPIPATRILREFAEVGVPNNHKINLYFAFLIPMCLYYVGDPSFCFAKVKIGGRIKEILLFLTTGSCSGENFIYTWSDLANLGHFLGVKCLSENSFLRLF